MVDDYGFFSAGAGKAVDEFIRNRPGQWRCDRPPEFSGHFVILSRKRPSVGLRLRPSGAEMKS